jgi:hypothetical protein
MALSQSVLSDPLDAFRAGEGVDLVRDAVCMVMQELIETAATEQTDAFAGTRDEWQAGDRRDLSEGSMAKLSPERDIDPVAELNPGD